MPLLWPVRLLGDAASPPLVLLHGFMGSHADWLPIAEPLSATHYCILPDLPGHAGNTAKDFGREHDLTFIGQGARIILDQLGIEQASILGYSLGGRVALQLALDAPHRVQQLILENANPGIHDPNPRAARLKLDRERAKKIKGDFPAFLENWYRAPLFSSMARQPERLEELMATRAKNDTDWLAKLIVELSPGTVVSHWERLAELAMPVGLIGGRLDAKYQLTLDQMQAQIPNARRYDIADAGHNAHWEKPGDYLKIVQDCLS